jgi:predicted deacylase
MRSSLTGFMPMSLNMTRVFGLVSVLAALFAGVYLYAAQTRDAGPTSPSVTSAEARAETTAAATNFQGVVASLQAWFAENGAYAGASLPPGSGVVLARADTSGYCLQTTAGGVVEHEVGPGGQPQAGPC